jgi:NAD(P)-dependent dehydrogenase (short-subunit alcohol dehydrogenase family)
MTAPLALVTGASRGIGAALAVRLAGPGAGGGHHVVLTARTEAGLIETDDAIHAAGGTATIAPVDLAKPDEIERLAHAVGTRWQALDLLVLNAAILGTLSPLPHADPAEVERVLALDLMAPFRLIRAFDPMLRRSRGVVVAITSSVANGGRAYWGPYAAAKAGLEAMVGSYADEMRALGVRALIVDPGATRTKMRARAYPGEDPQTLKTPDVVAERVAKALAAGLPAGTTRLALDKAGTPV